jgi:general secretion pathway protein D
MSSRSGIIRMTLAAIAVCALFACATFEHAAVKDARQLITEGRGEEALAVIEKAMKAAPENYALRTEYIRQRDLQVAQWLAQADALRLAGQSERAELLYQRALKYDSKNARARNGVEQAAMDQRHRATVSAADKLVKSEKYLDAEDMLRPVLMENPSYRDAARLQRLIEDKVSPPAVVTPRLRTSGTKPLSLELRDVTLRSVFDVIGRASGVSFVFDKDVRMDQKTSLVMRDATVEDLIKLALATNQLEQKVVNDTTVLVYPNTPQKLREHQDLVVKSFYLVNADVKQTANLIRSMLKTRDIFIDEKLNMLVIKDTPNAIRLAEKLVAAQDLAEPEVMLEVEVLEVGWNRLMELGLKFPDSLAWSLVGAAGLPGTVSLPEWLNRGAELVQLTFPTPLVLLTLRQQDGATSVLANPRIRVKNREKARIHIGDRVPVITTTAAATGGFVSESVSYLDVGLKLEVEPLIYLDDEVGIKVGLEVSNIAREVRSLQSSTLTYQIGTRNANTVLRLRDGETQVLAGLISDEDRRSASRVPGVGDLPVIGRLFSSTRDSVNKSEIVLLITPRLVRTIARPPSRAVEFAAGTDVSAGTGPVSAPASKVAPQAVKPKPPAPPTSAPPGSSLPSPDMVPFGGIRPQQQP